MRMCKFEIRNFKGVGEGFFEWDDIIVLIGENNTGKSTVLQALQCFLSGGQIKDTLVFLGNLTDAEHAIELIGHFDLLSDSEEQAQAVRGRMNVDKWIIKKSFWREEGEENGGEGTWKELYYSFSSEEAFATWPENENSWANFPQEYQDLIQDIIAYTVIYDEDTGNSQAPRENARIEALLGPRDGMNHCHVVRPTDLEGLLGYAASSDKAYRAFQRVEQLHQVGGFSPEFLAALNWVYFGASTEPHNNPAN